MKIAFLGVRVPGHLKPFPQTADVIHKLNVSGVPSACGPIQCTDGLINSVNRDWGLRCSGTENGVEDLGIWIFGISKGPQPSFGDRVRHGERDSILIGKIEGALWSSVRAVKS
jgi:hypothetical protein